MFERILVPLDGSKASEMVLPYAEEIATRLGSEIFLISVSGSPVDDSHHLYRPYLEPIVKQVQAHLTNLGAKEAKVGFDVLYGYPASEILRYANEIDAGLIAITSRGESGQGPWLLGNIAAKVLRATNRPVLLVRAPVSKSALRQKRMIKKILIPLDGSKLGESAIPFTETLARALGAELVLCHVLEPLMTEATYQLHVSSPTLQMPVPYPSPRDEERRKTAARDYLDGVGKLLSQRGLVTSSALVLGSPADQIIDFAKENAIDLIAMSTHGRTGIGRWVFGSVTDKVLHAGDTPLLVVRGAKT